MKIKNNNQNLESNYCIIHNSDWYDRQKIAGKLVAKSLKMCKEMATNFTALKISKTIEEFIISNNAIPTFKNYKGFPESVCISVNKELVHGIPKDIYFNNGDVVSFDLGVTYNGAIADAAITIIIGENKKAEKLIEVTEMALINSIKEINLNNKIGAMGEAIYKIGSKNNFQVISNYGGHFLGENEPHINPFISNKDKKENGFRFQNGMSFAIEPLFCLGFSNETKTLSDNWTVVTNDISAHFEHSIFIKNGNPEIMTVE